MDPTPLAVAQMVPWLLLQSSPAYEGAPLSRTAPPALCALLAAVTFCQQTARGGKDVTDQALTVTLLIALASTVLVVPAIRNDIARDGFQTHPSVGTLFAPSILAAIYCGGA